MKARFWKGLQKRSEVLFFIFMSFMALHVFLWSAAAEAQ
jgi:hypothetical protein